MARNDLVCAYCGARAQGEYTIHRDGFGVGPEVPLCNTHGSRELPTCEQIWDRIAQRRRDASKGVVTAEERAHRRVMRERFELLRDAHPASLKGTIAGDLEAIEAALAALVREEIEAAAAGDEARLARHPRPAPPPRRLEAAGARAVGGRMDGGMEESMKTHELKTWPEPFAAVARGEKTYEIRKADRDFDVGDWLRLREWDPETGEYSGEELQCSIAYKSEPGTWGLPADLCVLGVRLWDRTDFGWTPRLVNARRR